MHFTEQIDDIFNQRRTGLSENERRALHYSKQEIIEAYNSLRQLGLDNNISFTANIIYSYHHPEGYSYPLDVIIQSSTFFTDLDNIISMMRGERPHDWDGEPDAFDDLQHTINVAHNRLVLEAGRVNTLWIKVTAQIINNMPNEEDMALHWHHGELHSNNISQHIEADNLASMNLHQPSEDDQNMPDLIDEDGNVVDDNTQNNESDVREWEIEHQAWDIISAQARGDNSGIVMGAHNRASIPSTNVSMEHNNNEVIYESVAP
tara:strand:- start:258 stop:1043 length:786 start_codon:yes stop_codon:yes gene_type:complete